MSGGRSKTVTWADDPDSNYKKDEMQPSVAESGVNHAELPAANPSQYQSGGGAQYVDAGGDENQYAGIAQGAEEAHSSNQPNSNYYYDDGTYQPSDAEPSEPYFQDGDQYPEQQQPQFYYGDEQFAQMVNYYLYCICALTFMKFNFRSTDTRTQEPIHSYYEDGQQFANDSSEAQQQQQQQQTAQYGDEYGAAYPDQSADGGHESYYGQSDFNYYTNEPGENYYAENGTTDDGGSEAPLPSADYDYSNESNQFTGFVDADPIANATGEMALDYQSQQMQSPAAHDEPIPTAAAETAPATAAAAAMRQKIPNYLQSDTDESSQSIAIGPPAKAKTAATSAASAKKKSGKMKTTANAPPNVQSHDSDFDFSSNS